MVQKSCWRSSPGWGHLYHNRCSPDWTIVSYLFNDDLASLGNSWTQKTRWTKVKSRLKMRTFGGKNRSHKKNCVLDSFGLISGSFKLPETKNTSHEFLPFQSSSFYKYRSSFECVIRKFRNADSPEKPYNQIPRQKTRCFILQEKRHEPWNAGKGFFQTGFLCFFSCKRNKLLGKTRFTIFKWTRHDEFTLWFAPQGRVEKHQTNTL